MKHEKLKTY